MLLDLLIKSLFAGVLGWATVTVLRRSSASTRHTASLLALIGVSLLPAVALFLPRWHVPFIRLVGPEQPMPSPLHSAFLAHGSLAARTPQAHIDPTDLALLIWIAVAGILCLTMAIRLLKLHRAERSLPMLAEPAVQAIVTDRCRLSGRHVLLLEGATGEPPMTWGHARPVLLLPRDACGWQEDRIVSVVLHELAHIERSDWLASIAAQALCAIYWFNPFVWVIRRRMMVESEAAADDRVLSMGISATQYASHLVGVTRELQSARLSPNVALAMSRPGSLDRRIQAILESRRRRDGVRGSVTLGLAASIAGLVVIVGAAAPTIIRHESTLRQQAVTPPDVSVTAKLVAPEEGDPTKADSSSGAQVAESAQSSGNSNDDSSDDSSPTDNSTQGDGGAQNSKTESDCSDCPKAGRATVAHGEPAPSATASSASSLDGAMADNRSLPATPKRGAQVRVAGEIGDLRRTKWDGEVRIDLRDLDAQMREAGVKVDAATEQALKKLGSMSIDTKGLLDKVGRDAGESAKAAIEMAQRITKEQIRAAVRHMHHSDPEQPPSWDDGAP